MYKKLAIITASALVLGGCTVSNTFKTSDAAKDSQPMTSTSPIPTPMPDESLQTMPSTSSNNDTTSLETDINNTNILNEDFSDLN